MKELASHTAGERTEELLRKCQKMLCDFIPQSEGEQRRQAEKLAQDLQQYLGPCAPIEKGSPHE